MVQPSTGELAPPTCLGTGSDRSKTKLDLLWGLWGRLSHGPISLHSNVEGGGTYPTCATVSRIRYKNPADLLC